MCCVPMPFPVHPWMTGDHRGAESIYEVAPMHPESGIQPIFPGIYPWHPPAEEFRRMTPPSGYMPAMAPASPPTDYGGRPFVIHIEDATEQNDAFRSSLWTGSQLQVTLMSIPPGEDIGLEIHPHTDQFLRLEDGQGLVQMGSSPDRLDYRMPVSDDDAVFIPAGTWHNLTNTGREPIKLYSIYAPPNHPFGTVHRTKAEADEEEGHQ